METANNAGTHPARRAQAADSEGRSLGLHRDRGPRRLPGPRGQVLHRPLVSEQRIKHIDLVSLEPQSALIILVLEGNLIKQQVVHLDRPTSQDDLSRMAAMLNRKVKGQTAEELAGRLAQLGPDRGEQRRIIERVIESITTHQAQRQTVVLHDGVRNLLRHPEFVEVSRLEELLELLEQGAQLASILQQVAFEKDVEIIIGRENTSSGLRECSLVLTTYKMA